MTFKNRKGPFSRTTQDSPFRINITSKLVAEEWENTDGVWNAGTDSTSCATSADKGFFSLWTNKAHFSHHFSLTTAVCKRIWHLTEIRICKYSLEQHWEEHAVNGICAQLCFTTTINLHTLRTASLSDSKTRISLCTMSDTLLPSRISKFTVTARLSRWKMNQGRPQTTWRATFMEVSK